MASAIVCVEGTLMKMSLHEQAAAMALGSMARNATPQWRSKLACSSVIDALVPLLQPGHIPRQQAALYCLRYELLSLPCRPCSPDMHYAMLTTSSLNASISWHRALCCLQHIKSREIETETS